MLKKAVGDRLTESQMRDLWKMADIDGDGRLTREEVSDNQQLSQSTHDLPSWLAVAARVRTAKCWIVAQHLSRR